jgi:hypothetical protein
LNVNFGSFLGASPAPSLAIARANVARVARVARANGLATTAASRTSAGVCGRDRAIVRGTSSLHYATTRALRGVRRAKSSPRTRASVKRAREGARSSGSAALRRSSVVGLIENSI